MIYIIKILLLIGLIKLLFETNKPLLCASIYVGIGIIIDFVSGTRIGSLLIAGVISFILAAVYFWLLDRFQGSGLVYYVIMVVGFLIGLV